MSKKSIPVVAQQQPIVLLNESEVCVRLRISRPTLRAIRDNGATYHPRPLPYHILGCGTRQGIVYYAHEIDQWLAELPAQSGPVHYPDCQGRRRGRPRKVIEGVTPEIA